MVVESPQSDDARQDLRVGYLPQIFMKARGLVGHGLAHRRHAQRVQPTVQRSGAGPLQRGHNFGGIFGTEDSWFLIGAQVQRGQALRTQVEQIKRITNPAPFHQFLGHDPAQRLDIHCLALSEVFHAPCQLRRATRHVLATPSHLVLLSI